MKKILIVLILSLLCSEAGFCALNSKKKEAVTPKEKEIYVIKTIMDEALEDTPISTNREILQALELLKNCPDNQAYEIIKGKNPKNRSIKIEFDDLSGYGNKDYSNLDALGWERKNNLYIYINKKHKYAPNEALAALIAGRAFNLDSEDSINEEIYIYTQEALIWNFLSKDKVSDNKCPLVKRENAILKLFNASPEDSKYIKKYLLTEEAYKDLPMQSKGYTHDELEVKMKALREKYSNKN